MVIKTNLVLNDFMIYHDVHFMMYPDVKNTNERGMGGIITTH